jgi:hypothetical protein
LRYAINTANDNAELSNSIVFQPGLQGTIALAHGELAIQKSVEIVGPGEALLTIDGGHRSGVFDITNDPRARDVRVSGLTVTGGTGALDHFGSYSGGGLFNWSAAVTLTHVTFEGNEAAGGSGGGSGGGVDNGLGGTIVLNFCTVADNNARDGGGISNDGGSMTVNDSVITRNGSVFSGAISNRGPLTINRSTIAGNTSTSGSGGIFNIAGTVTVNASTIIDNVAGSRNSGGGIFNFEQMVITNSTIAGNSATIGGGIYNDGSMTISGSTIADNSSRIWGGGIASQDFDLNISNSTISGNTVRGGLGGGIFVIGSIGFNGYLSPSLELTAVTITLNTATAQGSAGGVGGGLWVEQRQFEGHLVSARVFIRNTIVAADASDLAGPDVLGPVISLGYNLIGATDNSSGWGATDLLGTLANPLDPRLGPLQANGGPTFTHALLADSPAVGFGDTALRATLDQRGTSRGGSYFPDIGAFEGAPAVQFRLVAPALVRPGQPFSLSVIALDAENHTASTYAGTIHFTSTDLSASLPGDYTFAPDDGGTQVFSTTLETPGRQIMAVFDLDNVFRRGSTTVDVTDARSFSGSPGDSWALLAWESDAGGVPSPAPPGTPSMTVQFMSRGSPGLERLEMRRAAVAVAHTFQVGLQMAVTEMIGVVDANSPFASGGAAVNVAGDVEPWESLATSWSGPPVM